MRLLLDASDSLLDAVCCSYLDRVKAVIKNNPKSIQEKTALGNSVLHVVGYCLHDEPEYDTYKSILDHLIFAGADISVTNNEGQTPIEFHLANGYETLAELLGEYS